MSRVTIVFQFHAVSIFWLSTILFVLFVSLSFLALAFCSLLIWWVITPLLLRDLEQKLLRLKDGVSLEKKLRNISLQTRYKLLFLWSKFRTSILRRFLQEGFGNRWENLNRDCFKFYRHAMSIKLTLYEEPKKNISNLFLMIIMLTENFDFV